MELMPPILFFEHQFGLGQILAAYPSKVFIVIHQLVVGLNDLGWLRHPAPVVKYRLYWCCSLRQVHLQLCRSFRASLYYYIPVIVFQAKSILQVSAVNMGRRKAQLLWP